MMDRPEVTLSGGRDMKNLPIATGARGNNDNNSNAYISKALSPSMSDLHEAQSAVVVVAFPPVRGFRENVRQFVPRLRFFFFFKWRLACAHYSVGQDQSTVAQRAETTVTECSLTSCVSKRSTCSVKTKQTKQPAASRKSRGWAGEGARSKY